MLAGGGGESSTVDGLSGSTREGAPLTAAWSASCIPGRSAPILPLPLVVEQPPLPKALAAVRCAAARRDFDGVAPGSGMSSSRVNFFWGSGTPAPPLAAGDAWEP